MKTEYEVEKAIERYADLVTRICLCRLKNRDDSEDVFQNVFLKYMLSDKEFESPEHEKAWMIRVTTNECKDIFRSLFRQRTTTLDQVLEIPATMDNESRELMSALLSIPVKYREVLYLHYYEGYSAKEIAAIFSKKEGTIYSLLSRGRDLLKKGMGGDLDE